MTRYDHAPEWVPMPQYRNPCMTLCDRTNCRFSHADQRAYYKERITTVPFYVSKTRHGGLKDRGHGHGHGHGNGYDGYAESRGGSYKKRKGSECRDRGL
jgi:hypothetical protein